MDKHRVLTELFMAIGALQSLINEESELPSLIEDSIWIAIKEICNIKVESKLDTKIREYVLESIAATKHVDEEPYKNLINYLLSSKIEMND